MHATHGGLNALRGLLALAVFAGHSFDVFVKPSGATPFLADALNNAAHAAVTCFFVLSGYVIAMSLDANRRRGFSVADYAAARVMRIAPPLLATIALTWLAAAFLQAVGLQRVPSGARESFVTDPAAQLLALVSIGTAGQLEGGLNGPLWSLVYEMQFYVGAGLVAATLFSRARLLAGLLLVAWGIAYFDGIDSKLAMFLAFALGSAAYVLRGAPCHRTIAAALIAAALGAACLLWSGDATVADLTRHRLLLAFDVAMAALCALLIQAIARTGALQGWSRLGDASYTLYILHFPALLFFDCIGAGALGIPAALVLCWMVGLAVERPKEQRRAVVHWLRLMRA